MAWLPLLALLLAMGLLWAVNLRTEHESPYLLIGLNIIFSALASLAIAWLIGRSFILTGNPGLLLVGCGVVIWGSAALVGIAAGLSPSRWDINLTITIHNVCVWLSGLCHLSGVVYSLRARRTIHATGRWLLAGYGLALGAVALIVLAAVADWLPVFFVQGQGGTAVRHSVLGSAVALFVLTAVLLWAGNRPSLSPFVHWYALALLLIAVGLFGILIETVHGGALSWTGRAAQLLSGVYMLIAALASRRESLTCGTAPAGSIQARYGYGVAIALVLAATALRLAFLQSLGTRVTYITFYPAVMLAALYGGLSAGLLAAVLSAALAVYLWVEPAHSFAITHPADLLGTAVFLVSCAMISWITEAMRRAQARAIHAEAAAKAAAERALAAEVIRRTEQRLRFALETSRTGAWDLDLVDHSAFRSLEHDRIFGYEQLLPAWTYEDFLEHVLPEDRADVDAKFRRAIDRQTDWDFECRIRRADGEVRWIWAAGCHREDAAGGLRRMAGIVQDITEHKQAEEALRQSREDLDRAQAVGQIGWWRLDTRRNVLTWSDENHRIFGLPKGTPLTYQAFLAAIHPDDRASVDAQWQAGLRGEPYDVEHRIVTDGQIKWVREKAYLEFDAAGQLLGGFGITQDVTARKQAEDALRETRDYLEKLLTYANAPVICWDRRRAITRFNPAFERLTGYAASEVVGKDLSMLFSDETRDESLAKIERALTERWEVVEISIQRKDGETRVALWNSANVYAEDGTTILATIAQGQDITERKQAEEALRLSEQRERHRAAELATMLDAVPTPVVIVHDPDARHMTGNRATHELLHNPPNAEVSLSAPADVRPRHFKAVKDGRELRLDELPAQRAARGEHVRDFEFTLAFDDGTARHVLGYGTPLLDDKGQPRGAVHVLVDMTQRRQAEEALRHLTATLEQKVAQRTAEAEQRAAQLRALAASLTKAEERERRRLAQVLHDHLQQILVAAKMRVASLQTKAQPKSWQEQMREVADLLDESIRESRSLTAELSPAVLYESGLSSALHWLGRHMAEKHALIVQIDAEDQAQPANTDLRVVIFQAARELLFNVVKHAGVDRARVALTRVDAHVRLVVEDQGKGIDPATLENRSAAGGFGLFSLRERLELVGGRMTLASAPGQGTRVTLHVPLPAQDLAAAPPQSSVATPQTQTRAGAAPEHKPIRIVLADDHRIVREGLAGLLSAAQDMEIVGQAADGRQAVELAQHLRPDVVVMDVNMPGLGGVEATRQIVGHVPGVKVIGLSMHERDTAGPALIEAGASAYIRKDGPAEELLAAIRACVATETPNASP